jgi:hypothetical protein
MARKPHGVWCLGGLASQVGDRLVESFRSATSGATTAISPRQISGVESAYRQETDIAYGVVHHFPGGTKEQYEASIAAVHPTPDSLPDGQISHFAGPSADGWTITVVHESQDSWERFRDDILMPRMQQGIEGGFATPPEESTFNVYKSMP